MKNNFLLFALFFLMVLLALQARTEAATAPATVAVAVQETVTPRVLAHAELEDGQGKRLGTMMRLVLPVTEDLPWNRKETYESLEALRYMDSRLPFTLDDDWLATPMLVELGGQIYQTSKKMRAKRLWGASEEPYVSFEVTVVVKDVPVERCELRIFRFSDKIRTAADLKGVVPETTVTIPAAANRAKPIAPKVSCVEIFPETETARVELAASWTEGVQDERGVVKPLLSPEVVEAVHIGKTVSEGVVYLKSSPKGKVLLVAHFKTVPDGSEPVFFKLKGVEDLVKVGRAEVVLPPGNTSKPGDGAGTRPEK